MTVLQVCSNKENLWGQDVSPTDLLAVIVDGLPEGPHLADVFLVTASTDPARARRSAVPPWSSISSPADLTIHLVPSDAGTGERFGRPPPEEPGDNESEDGEAEYRTFTLPLAIPDLRFTVFADGAELAEVQVTDLHPMIGFSATLLASPDSTGWRLQLSSSGPVAGGQKPRPGLDFRTVVSRHASIGLRIDGTVPLQQRRRASGRRGRGR